MEHLRELYDQIKERNHHGIKKSNQSERIIYALTAMERAEGGCEPQAHSREDQHLFNARREKDEEHLREAYDQIKEYNPHGYRIDFAAALEEFKQELKRAREDYKAGMDFESTPAINEMLNEENRQRNKPGARSRTDRYLINAEKIKDINKDEGIIVPCDDYVYGYQDLSFEQFCSYLYWRTQVRQKHFCETPIPYLCLYLIELCNFVEYDTVEESYEAILSLAEHLSEEKAKAKAYDALSEFLIYYGPAEEAKKYYNYERFQQVKIQLSFLNGTHLDPFDYLTRRAPHKIKKSAVYQENPAIVEEQFLVFFYDVLKLLKENGVDLLPLWVGRYALTPIIRSHAIKEIDRDRIVEKRFVEDGLVVLEVTKDLVTEATIVSQGQTADPGMCIFHGSYIINYLVRAFENELRKKAGKRQLKVSTKDIRAMLNHGEKPMLKKIVEVYESDAFAKCVREAVNNTTKENCNV